ncbi:MAG TPA: FlgD immunoglobulin-like domain containing protein, partial [Saprospiraceae bacterium]|nr:FlgD immunoglobulin-like domain containing protein [Saprospiraceae bacterium]
KEGFLFGSKLFQTSDGGKSWQVYNETDSILISSAEVVKFVNRKSAWIAGGDPTATDGGFVGATTDSGRGWMYQRRTGILPGLDFLDTLKGFVTSWVPAYVHSTKDGGIHWLDQPFQYAGFPNDIRFLDSLHGWIAATKGKISSTTDGGATWIFQQTIVSADLRKISVLPTEKFVYVFGDSNTLLYADLITEIKPDPPLYPFEFSLSQNFPNPFNSQTTIEYTVDRNSLIQLRIFNLLGQEVKVLVDDIQPAGRHTSRWDGTSDDGRVVPSGIYISALKSGYHFSHRKIVFIK